MSKSLKIGDVVIIKDPSTVLKKELNGKHGRIANISGLDILIDFSEFMHEFTNYEKNTIKRFFHNGDCLINKTGYWIYKKDIELYNNEINKAFKLKQKS